ncbi:MAG: hypothetical protein AABX17_02290 [Nanoarchaeota archaeon]
MEFNLLMGIFGMLSLLAGLLLLLTGKIKETSKAYLWLNIFGGALLFYYSYSLNSIPFMILQAVWTIIPLYKLIFSKR